MVLKNRSRVEILYDIASAAKPSSKKTHLMYKGPRKSPEIVKRELPAFTSVYAAYIYVAKSGENQLALSIWDAPRKEKTSHCLFADRISISAYMAAVDYWRPRYQATQTQ